jgi:hypothetical protein
MDPFKTLKPEWVRFLMFPVDQIWLPTEIVISKPGFQIPKVARVYATELYLLDKERTPGMYDTLLSVDEELRRRAWPIEEDDDRFEVVDYQGLLDLGDDFKGTSHHPDVLLAEVWENWGDDGHTQMSMTAYRFVNGWRFGQAFLAAEGSLGGYDSPLVPFIRRHS